MADGAYLIPAVGLLAVIFHILFKERKNIKDANKKIDDKIVEKAKLLIENDEMDVNLDIICRLRRRKAHLQKDMQNCAGLWSLSALFLFACELSSKLTASADGDSITTLIALAMAASTFLLGMCYLWRLVYEIKKINSEANTR
jgi:hypothetical protein